MSTGAPNQLSLFPDGEPANEPDPQAERRLLDQQNLVHLRATRKMLGGVFNDRRTDATA